MCSRVPIALTLACDRRPSPLLLFAAAAVVIVLLVTLQSLFGDSLRVRASAEQVRQPCRFLRVRWSFPCHASARPILIILIITTTMLIRLQERETGMIGGFAFPLDVDDPTGSKRRAAGKFQVQGTSDSGAASGNGTSALTMDQISDHVASLGLSSEPA